MSSFQYKALLFRSVSETMKAETVMQKNGITHKIIPIPKKISADCGICIRVDPPVCADAIRVLEGHVRIESIADI